MLYQSPMKTDHCRFHLHITSGQKKTLPSNWKNHNVVKTCFYAIKFEFSHLFHKQFSTHRLNIIYKIFSVQWNLDFRKISTCIFNYTSVLNRRASTFIDLLIPPCMALFWCARLLFFEKKFPLNIYSIPHVYWYSCRLLNFEKKFSPARPYFGLNI